MSGRKSCSFSHEKEKLTMNKTHLHQKSLRTALRMVAGLSLLLMPLNAFASDSTIASPDSAITKEIRNLISNYHVSGVKSQDLEGKNVEGMLKSLNDPYTVYFDSKKLQQFYSSLNNNYVGIGTRLGEDAHGVYIAEVFAGSPAEKAGLLKGDYVISVNGNSTKNAPTDSIISQVIGDIGTSVDIGIERDGAELSFTMQRDQIVLPSVTGQLIGEGVGYAKISTFSSEADEQLSKLLDTFKNQGMKSLVLDLRNNPGGYVDTASNILKNFLKQGKLMQVKERDGSMNEITFSEGKELDVKVFILVNSNSASASEVLTGAMQDYGLATVIGTQTYGKGSVQSLFSLSDGGAAKITIEE
jgi:carboxyl-terminal processing protease